MLLEEYDIKSAKDIEEAHKDLLGGTIQEMLESEMDEHLGYQEYERSDNPDYRNGKKLPDLSVIAYGEVYCIDEYYRIYFVQWTFLPVIYLWEKAVCDI